MTGAPLRLSTLGHLVRTLVPRSELVVIFDLQARISWATDTAEHEDLRALAAELLGGADKGGSSYSMRCELDAAASYAFLMRNPAGAATGVLALTIAGPFRRSDLLRPAALESRLAPLLAVGAFAVADTAERLIAVLADRLEAEAVIACLPGEDFSRSFRRAGSQLPEVATLQRLASRELAPRTAQAASPLRVDKARIDTARVGPDSPVFGFVSVPLRRGSGSQGVLAAFATQARRPFSIQDAELLTRSAVLLTELLG